MSGKNVRRVDALICACNKSDSQAKLTDVWGVVAVKPVFCFDH